MPSRGTTAGTGAYSAALVSYSGNFAVTNLIFRNNLCLNSTANLPVVNLYTGSTGQIYGNRIKQANTTTALWQADTAAIFDNFAVATGPQTFYVDAASGSTGATGLSRMDPFPTLALAITACTASRGDTIIVLSSHTESIAAATEIALSKADVTVIGEGSGDNRPTITATNAAGNIPISGAGTRLENIILTCSGTIDVSNGITVTAAGCTIKDVQIRAATSTDEFVVGILTNASADRLKVIGLDYVGFVAGNGSTTGIALIGTTDVKIVDCNFYGNASTSFINMLTTLSTNVLVKNCVFHNAATPTFGLTTNVAMNIAACTFKVLGCYDARVGAYFDGTEINGLGLTASELSCEVGPLVASSAVTAMYTVYGTIELTRLHGIVTTVMTADATTLRFQYNPDAAGAVNLCADGTVTSDDVGDHYNVLLDAAATVLTETNTLLPLFGLAGVSAILHSKTSGTITQLSSQAAQTGAIRYTMSYKPLRGAFVIPAA